MTGEARQGQEGSRWVNQRPTGAEVRDWFVKNVPIEDGMDVDRYVTGVVLIQSTDKENVVTGFSDQNLPIYREERHIVYTPYIQVDARVLYFYDLCRRNKWYGVIEPVEVERVTDPNNPYFNGHLPPGFFIFKVRKESDQVVTFVGCSMRVVITNPNDETDVVLQGPTGTKIVPVMGRYDVDENSVMKAETGAIGRALGAAGILVAPGSGIASAEDVAESINSQGTTAVKEGTTTEATQASSQETATADASPNDLREEAKRLVRSLKENFPVQAAEFSTWAQSRNFTKLSLVPDEDIKGVVKKLEKLADEAAQNVERQEPKADDDESLDVVSSVDESA